MRKILFIIRDGFDAKLIISEISKFQGEYKIFYILESGRTARTKKIKRMLKKNGMSALVNMAALIIYDRFMTNKMRNLIAKDYSYPSSNQYYNIDDVNEEKCIQICNQIGPDLIMIYGSGILKSNTIEMLKGNIYNIHSSVLPHYRNVHSDFWAYAHHEYNKIGVTIFKLNAGIDMGNIAIQKISDLKEGAKLEEYKVRNLYIIIELLKEFWHAYFLDKITLTEQNPLIKSIASTPTTKDLIRYFQSRRQDCK